MLILFPYLQEAAEKAKMMLLWDVMNGVRLYFILST